MAIDTSFSPHGNFTLALHGRVVFLTMTGIWNEECVKRFEAEFPEFLKANGIAAPWGVLTDLRPWEGGTPEAMARIAGNMDWLHSLGMAASARVVTEQFFNAMIEHEVQQDSPYDVFTDPDLGLAWLASRGFDCKN